MVIRILLFLLVLSYYKPALCSNHASVFPGVETQIDTNIDRLDHFGSVSLSPIASQHVIPSNIYYFDNTSSIHRIDVFQKDTLTVNFLGTEGDKTIDIFISNRTPHRRVLLKKDTREKPDAFNVNYVIDKCIDLLDQD